MGALRPDRYYLLGDAGSFFEPAVSREKLSGLPARFGRLEVTDDFPANLVISSSP